MYTLLPVLLASLLGSPHCIAMCGGFAMLGSGRERRISSIFLYHLGRLLTYLGVGYGAYRVAGAVTAWSALIGVQVSAQLIIGALLLVSGVILTLNALGIRFSAPALDVHRPMASMYRRFVSAIGPTSRIFPFVVGLASTLLPCGWLYVYVGIAAQSPAPLTVMTVFWLGTLPILTAWGGFSSYLLAKIGRYFPLIRATTLVLAGVLSLIQHADLVPRSSPGAELQCH